MTAPDRAARLDRIRARWVCEEFRYRAFDLRLVEENGLTARAEQWSQEPFSVPENKGAFVRAAEDIAYLLGEIERMRHELDGHWQPASPQQLTEAAYRLHEAGDRFRALMQQRFPGPWSNHDGTEDGEFRNTFGDYNWAAIHLAWVALGVAGDVARAMGEIERLEAARAAMEERG